MTQARGRNLANWLSDRAWRLLLAVLRALPYTRRIPVAGWLTARLLGPLAGFSRRTETNLRRIWPELPEAHRRRIARAALDNAGRTIVEIYSGEPLKARVAGTRATGPGLAALDAAGAEGRPVVLVTGHFGNYAAAWVVLRRRGLEIAGLYRPMSNPWFDAHYARAMERHGGPIFRQDRRGTTAMLRHLRRGGMAVILLDQHRHGGARLDFLGLEAATSTEPAEIALRLGALLVPFYGIRTESGLDFEVVVEAPIPHGEPATMTQAFNDSLSARIRAHPGQWFWPHRRWKTTPEAISAAGPPPAPGPDRPPE